MTNRLLAIADLIESGMTIADIGSDHAYLPIHLVECGRVRRAIASEIARGPCDNAIKNVQAHGLSDVIEIRLGAGLAPYTAGEVDCYVIAGMGGHTIASIIGDDMDKVRQADYLIVQPMQNRPYLRKYLYERQFSIDCEIISREGNKFYHVIKVVPRTATIPDQLSLIIGVNPVKNAVFYHYISYLINHKKSILGQLSAVTQVDLYQRHQTELTVLEEVYHARERQ